MDVEWPAVSDSRIAEVLDDVDVVVVIVGPRWLEQIAAERGPDHQDEEVELLAAALTRPLPLVLVLVDARPCPNLISSRRICSDWSSVRVTAGRGNLRGRRGPAR